MQIEAHLKAIYPKGHHPIFPDLFPNEKNGDPSWNFPSILYNGKLLWLRPQFHSALSRTLGSGRHKDKDSYQSQGGGNHPSHCQWHVSLRCFKPYIHTSFCVIYGPN